MFIWSYTHEHSLFLPGLVEKLGPKMHSANVLNHPQMAYGAKIALAALA
jgi:hypothetical protein